ncbi:restriction endonuclease subunit S [Photobacterium piscicola]|uniref:restriction endonuclease subunit S n=1 Tax=Photobacterium piscicola TaxID=1378299 RepID=UPI0038CFB5EF
MTVESLITQHIDTWTSAVKNQSTSGRGSRKKLELYGVKKLRELILELAVRGKLVPQDPSDEPASVLLERIAAEKAQLVRDKIIPRTKALPELLDSDIPNDLPTGWSIVRLGNLTSKLGSGSTPRGGKTAYVEEGVPFLRSQNIRNEGIKLDDIAYIPMETHQKMEKTKVLPNDVLLNITGASLGRSTIFPESLYEANVSQHVTIIRLIESKMSSFIHLGILSPMVQKLVWGRQVGMAIEGLSKKVLEMFEFPVPPLAEQHRIVAKVDELMTLCDQLEQQTEASIEAHQLLVSTLLCTLANSADANELMDNWARISDHFDTLFTTEESIDQLKQTILQLAVMGKLVPQDPNDEPASVLLERIALHQQLRIKNKEIQKPKKVVIDDTLDLETPSGWHQVLLNDLVFVTKLAGFEYTKYINLEDAGDVAVIRAQNVRPFSPDLENLKYIDKETSLNLPRSAIDRPALLVTFIGAGIGDVCVFNRKERWHLAPNVAKVEPYADLNLHYLCIYLNSPIGRKELFKSMKSTAQPSLSMTTIREIWVKLPPCTEQVKIVKVVESLFSTCEQLKKRLKESQVTQLHLTDAIIEQAV